MPGRFQVRRQRRTQRSNCSCPESPEVHMSNEDAVAADERVQQKKSATSTLLMVAAVFAISAGTGGAWIALGGFSGIQERLAGKKAADGMRYMPDQTRLILSVRPADMLKAAAFDELKKDPKYRD